MKKELVLEIKGTKDSYNKYELYKITLDSGAEYYKMYGIDDDGAWYFGMSSHEEVAEKLLAQIKY